MQQRRGERAERDHPEQDERGRGREKVVERVGGIDGREGDRRAGGGEDRRDIGDRQRRDGGDALLAARPFAGGEQRQREQAAEQGAHAGAEQTGLDRIAHHEEAAERQRQAADPDHPAGAEAFLEAGLGWRQRRRLAAGPPVAALGAARLSFATGAAGRRFRRQSAVVRLQCRATTARKRLFELLAAASAAARPASLATPLPSHPAARAAWRPD